MTAMEKWDGRDKPTTVEVLPRVTLNLSEDATRDEWEECGSRLRNAAEQTQWMIGEWLNFGERKWGDTYKRASEITGYAIQTLKNIASVTSKSVPARVRLTFAHHREIATLPAPEQERWLDKAEKEEWSTRELRDQLRLTREHETKATSEPAIPNCRQCGEPCRVCLGDARLAKKKAKTNERKR